MPREKTKSSKDLKEKRQKQSVVGEAWSQSIFLAGIAVLGLVATLLLLWSTAEHGIGVRSDSVEYVWAAETLAQGIGLGRLSGEGAFKPLIEFPPLYSTSLAIFEWIGVGAWEGARWLAAVFFAANIVLIGLVVLRLTSSRIFSLSAAGFALMAPAVFEVNLWAMTEAPYVTFVLLGFLLLDDFFRVGHTRRLVWAGVFLGLAFLTRYVGATALAAAGLVLLVQPGKPWLQKIKEGALLAAVAGLPMALWLIRNLIVGGSATNKIINYHPITAQKWKVFTSTLANWLAPLQNFFLIGKRKLIIFISSGLGAWLFYRHSESGKVEPSQANWLGWLFIAYIPLYLFLVFFSVMFTGAAIPLDDRMMYPVYTMLIVGFFTLLFFIWKRSYAAAPMFGLVSLILSAVIIFTLADGYAAKTLALATESRERGKGYALTQLAERDVVQAFLRYPDDYLIYTDNVHQLYYFSGRLAYLFPVALDSATQLEIGEGYSLTLQDIQHRLNERQKVMFVFFFADEVNPALVAELFPQMVQIVGGEQGYLYINQGN